MTSRFFFLRVRPAHRDENRHEPRDVEWLIAEWPKGEGEPTKLWLYDAFRFLSRAVDSTGQASMAN
jgi:hypothetical protein